MYPKDHRIVTAFPRNRGKLPQACHLEGVIKVNELLNELPMRLFEMSLAVAVLLVLVA